LSTNRVYITSQNHGFAENIDQAAEIAAKIGYPVIVRPAYTMGGTGGGVADNLEELKEITARGFKHSLIGQVLIEKSISIFCLLDCINWSS